MDWKRIDRLRAAGIHLGGSAALALLLLAGIFVVWYPEALFVGAGGRRLFLLIAGMLLATGPLLTLILFVPGKKGLAFDLGCVAVLQAATFAFGLWVLYHSRPVYIVFVKDRFELVRANEYPSGELERAHRSHYADMPWTGPRIVGAQIPTEVAERNRVMFLGPTGVDIQHMPQHYVAYGEVKAEVLDRARPLSELGALNPGASSDIDRLVSRSGRASEALAFLPLRTGTLDLTVLIDRHTAEPLRIVFLRPWEF